MSKLTAKWLQTDVAGADPVTGLSLKAAPSGPYSTRHLQDAAERAYRLHVPAANYGALPAAGPTVQAGDICVTLDNGSVYTYRGVSEGWVAQDTSALEQRVSFGTTGVLLGNQDWTSLVKGPAGWGAYTSYQAGQRGIRLTGVARRLVVGLRAPVDPEATYVVVVRARQAAGDGSFRAGAASLSSGLTDLSTDDQTPYNWCIPSTIIPTGQAMTLVGTLKGYNPVAPAAGSAGAFDPEANYWDLVIEGNNGATNPSSQLVVEGVYVYRAPTHLKVDGSLEVLPGAEIQSKGDLVFRIDSDSSGTGGKMAVRKDASGTDLFAVYEAGHTVGSNSPYLGTPLAANTGIFAREDGTIPPEALPISQVFSRYTPMSFVGVPPSPTATLVLPSDGVEVLWVGGAVQVRGTDYTRSGLEVTPVSPWPGGARVYVLMLDAASAVPVEQIGVGNGTQAVFTLPGSGGEGSLNWVGNALQDPGDYTIVGNQITYLQAPAAGMKVLAMGAPSSGVFNPLAPLELVGTGDGVETVFPAGGSIINEVFFVGGAPQARYEDYEPSFLSKTVVFSSPPAPGAAVMVARGSREPGEVDATTLNGFPSSYTPAANQVVRRGPDGSLLGALVRGDEIPDLKAVVPRAGSQAVSANYGLYVYDPYYAGVIDDELFVAPGGGFPGAWVLAAINPTGVFALSAPMITDLQEQVDAEVLAREALAASITVHEEWHYNYPGNSFTNEVRAYVAGRELRLRAGLVGSYFDAVTRPAGPVAFTLKVRRISDASVETIGQITYGPGGSSSDIAADVLVHPGDLLWLEAPGSLNSAANVAGSLRLEHA